MGSNKGEPPDKPEVLDSIDRVIHEPARLKVLALLYVVKSADFLFIMTQTGLTFGNLCSHMNKLQEAGYISVVKDFVGKKPHTMLSLTEKGRTAFKEYRKTMQQFFDELPG